ncbi:MAG: cupin domain-containing protein [Phycisphaerae bacterium]
MLKRIRSKWAAWMTVLAVGSMVMVMVLPSHGGSATSKPTILKSEVVSWEDAPARKADWGEMRFYFQGETTATRDLLVAVAIVEPGKAVHRAHRHAEEEYLVINEGIGIWQLGEKTSPARKSDILYVEPWVYHGLTNTGDKPLVFTVVRYNGKGVLVPPRPDSRDDER